MLNSPGRRGAVAETLGWMTLFALAVLAGRSTRIETSEIALAWPAAGVAVVWLLHAFSHRALVMAVVALFGVTVLVNIATGVEPTASGLFGVVNVAHGLVAVAVLGALGGWRTPRPPASLRDVGVLLAGSLAASGVSAVLGALLAWTRFDTDFWAGMGLFGVRNTVSTFVVAAALLALPHLQLDDRRRRVKLATTVGVALGASLLVIQASWPISYALIPPAVLIAIVCGPAVTSVVVALQGVLIVIATRSDGGPFSTIDTPEYRVLDAQGLILVLAVMSLVIAFAVQERSAALAASSHDRDRLRDHMDAALVASAHVVVGADGVPRTVDANVALSALTGHDHDDLVGCDPGAWLTPEAAAVLADGLAVLGRGDRDLAGWRAQLQLNGSFGGSTVDAALSVVVPGAERNPDLVELNLQMIDVTAQKEAEERLADLALRDELTGLPNRALWSDRAEMALRESARSGRPIGVLYVDVDHFKAINDTYGHDVGDDLLRELARRMEALVRPHDTVARLGGDEFVILCPLLSAREDGERLASRLQQAMKAPFQAGSRQIEATVSIGVAYADGGEVEPRLLLRRADTALYSAKERGRARFEVYRPDLHAALERSVKVLEELEQAHANGELTVYYQPIVEAVSHRIVAVEALLRWENPEVGTLTPGFFLEVLESNDLVHRVGDDVLRSACRAGASLLEQGRPLDVHVNISARELSRPGLVNRVRAALDETGMPAELLVLEITETRLVTVNGSLLDDLLALRTTGVRFAVDDFGAGYSTLTHLVDLPVDILKLDKGFVSDVVASASARAVCSGVRAMASGLRIASIAEGVETPAQAALLEELGYGQLQGFLFGSPGPLPEILALLDGPTPSAAQLAAG